jgi:hypothetical protein
MPRSHFARFLPFCVLAALNALAQQPFELLRIDANPTKGFNWPYYLTVPTQTKTPAVLLVVPNNTGSPSDDQSLHDASAQTTATSWGYGADSTGLRTPVLTPTFPRPASDMTMYTQALDRATLLTRTPGLQRIDLQLVAMIQDAKARLAVRGMQVDSRVWMYGFSATGSFVSRFIHLHPDVVKSAIFGSGGYGPPVPLAEYKERVLEYPWGVADIEQLTGQKFNLDAFRQIQILTHFGDAEVPDFGWDPGNDPDLGMLEEVFGYSDGFAWRHYPIWEAVYQSVGSAAQFRVLPGVGHIPLDYATYAEFFEKSRNSPALAPPPKPQPYTLYFPHLECGDSWDTQLTLTYTVDGAQVQGELRAFGNTGGAPLETVPVTLPPAAEKAIAACTVLASAHSAAYLAFVSDSGFVEGHETLSRAGATASMSAIRSMTSGIFPNLETQGWMTLGFANPGPSAVTVSLSAFNDAGAQIAAASLPLAPGAKSSATPGSLFGASVQAASVIRFSAPSGVLAFLLQGSSDGRRLDGHTAVPDYAR